MLKKLTIKNLGCFNDESSSLDFTEQTLMAGPNNSGKSLFLTGVNIIRQLALGQFSWTNNMYNLVSFNECVHNHDESRTISVSLVVSQETQETTLGCEISKAGISIKINDQPINLPPSGLPNFPPNLQNRNLLDLQRRMRFVVPPAEISGIMKQIWYVRPYRLPIQYSSNVQPTSGPLQPLNPDGSNVINYILERWTDRDKKWDYAESWLKKIEPRMSEMKTPIRGNLVSFETMYGEVPVNLSMQGSGFQNAAAIISALVFSPEGSTIILEEPEAFLHPPSQEVLVDLINDVVNNQKKQVIFATHSTNILLSFFRDVSHNGARRSIEHPKADPAKFSMWTMNYANEKISIERYPIENKTYPQFRNDFKFIWG